MALPCLGRTGPITGGAREDSEGAERWPRTSGGQTRPVAAESQPGSGVLWPHEHSRAHGLQFSGGEEKAALAG